MTETELKELISTENEHLRKLHAIVEETVNEEQLIVNNLLNPPQEELTRGQRISDKVARFGGSWMFIITFGLVLAVWIAFNVLVPDPDKFDPYPFILMNLVLSTIAALQAPIIMMSQNRQEEKDRTRAKNDYIVNLKSELEIQMLHEKIDHLIMHQQQELLEIQQVQIDMMNDIMQVIKKK